MYSHPLAEHMRAKPGITVGDMVEHRDLPGIPLVIVSGPHDGLFGRKKYIVKLPSGEQIPVLEKNLIK